MKINRNQSIINSFQIEGDIRAALKGKAHDISASEKNDLLITVRNAEQSKNIISLKTVDQ